MEIFLGPITLNLTPFLEFFIEQSIPVILFELFAIIGWMPVAYYAVHEMVEFWLEYKEDKATHNWQWVVLAVDIPLLNVQTPKAVEQMFAHLAGALDEPDVMAKFRTGHKQRTFSFEIVSIEGYIQFIIRTEAIFRDLVEAAMYAQYPEAQVVEIEDYVGRVPDTYPNPTHDVWASDFILAEHSGYPIRTYRDFEHSISKDTVLKDPMGAFLESFSRIGPGEQMWFQIILQPIGNKWKEKSIEKIKDIIGDTSGKHAHKGNALVDALAAAPFKILESVGDQLFGTEAVESGGHDAKEGPPNQLQYLTPGQSKTVEAMEDKIMKIGFKTKMRGMYVARKEVFRPERGVNALIGAINQYNIPSANSIVPKSFPKQKMVTAFKKRKLGEGADPYVLNIEELATVWHFPMSHVKTPLVQKTLGKQAEPPSSLPVEVIPLMGAPVAGSEPDKPKKRTFVTDSGEIGYDEDVRYG